ncbi:MAG: class I SAM-dependent methyltransferase [Sumerlaeia bacterium]
MNIAEYEKMYELEDTYWWFQGRKKMIQSILKTYMKTDPRPGRVLDVGCGTGLILQTYKHWNPIGADFSPLALQFCQSRGITRTVRADVIHLPFEDNSLDLILALDLIEHVDRDDLLIKEFNRVLKPGGYLMATVPAHPSLWSDHDIALHHFRRYTKASFGKLMRLGKLKPVKYTFGIFFLHPVVVVFRSIQKQWQRSTGLKDNRQAKTHLIALPLVFNRILIELLRVEAFLLKYINFPTGTSLVALAQKPLSSPQKKRKKKA